MVILVFLFRDTGIMQRFCEKLCSCRNCFNFFSLPSSYCHGSSCHGCGHGCGSSHFCSNVASMNNYKNLEHYHRSLSDSYRHRAEDIRRHCSI